MMDHANGWMTGWMDGGGIWLWPVLGIVGVVLLALLVVAVFKVSNRKS